MNTILHLYVKHMYSIMFIVIYQGRRGINLVNHYINTSQMISVYSWKEQRVKTVINHRAMINASIAICLF